MTVRLPVDTFVMSAAPGDCPAEETHLSWARGSGCLVSGCPRGSGAGWALQHPGRDRRGPCVCERQCVLCPGQLLTQVQAGPAPAGPNMQARDRGEPPAAGSD